MKEYVPPEKYCSDCTRYIPLNEKEGDCLYYEERRKPTDISCHKLILPYIDPMAQTIKEIGVIIGSMATLSIIVSIIRWLFK